MSLSQFKNLKLLYVEDDDSLRLDAMIYFNRIFDETYEASNALEAYKIYKNKNPQIIITDIKMDKISGLELVKKIRNEDKKCQIIILSAFTDKNYLLEAIELNLVKYLIKPVNPTKLYSCLLQCAQNLKKDENNLIYLTQDCIYDSLNKVLNKKNQMVKLSKNELNFLDLLCSNTNKTFTYEEIQNFVCDEYIISLDSLRTMVRKLRKKLPLDTLVNISKIGYKIQCLN